MFVANSKLQSALKSSQISVDLLESISATELAQSVPFLRIQRIDPRKRIPLEGEPILNLYFQKPPEFGSSLSTRERYGERPPVSIKSFSIETKLMNGLDVQQEVSFQITIHRPSALTDPEENKWMSLITPMNTHLIEYGWVGTSKNGIINGEGIKDNDVFVDSVKSLVFTTAFYNFKVNNNGTIDITAKGYENGGYMLNRMYLGDRIKFHEDVNADNSAQARKRKPLEKINNKELRETLQKIIRDLRSDKQTSFGISGRRYAKLIDVLNALVAKSIVEVSNLWGFDQINLQIGDLNGRVPKLSRKFKNKKITNIGDFPVDLEKMIKFINTQTRKGSSITMKNFLYNLIQDTVNNSTSYGRGKPIKFNGRVLSEEIPMVRIKVIGTLSKRNKKNVFNIIIFDAKKELVQNFEGEELYPINGKISRDKIKKKLRERNIPFIALGKGTAFIKDSDFEVEMDNAIQAVKLDEANQKLKDRSDIVSKTTSQNIDGVMDPVHILWSSAMQGEITMLGNFVFDTFAYIWLDFGIDIWSGPFNIVNKMDKIGPGTFETKITVKSEGQDPLNTKRQITKEEMQRRADIAEAEKDLARAKKRGRKRDISNVQARLDILRAAGDPRFKDII